MLRVGGFTQWNIQALQVIFSGQTLWPVMAKDKNTMIQPEKKRKKKKEKKTPIEYHKEKFWTIRPLNMWSLVWHLLIPLPIQTKYTRNKPRVLWLWSWILAHSPKGKFNCLYILLQSDTSNWVSGSTHQTGKHPFPTKKKVALVALLYTCLLPLNLLWDPTHYFFIQLQDLQELI